MNKNGEKIVAQIREEIRELEKKGRIPKEKKAYYIYRRIGELCSYKEAYALTELVDEEEEEKKANLYNEELTEDGQGTFTDIIEACVQCMKQEDINSYVSYKRKSIPFSHVDGCFEVDGKWYFFDLSEDIMNIQTGMRTDSFAISHQKIVERLSNYRDLDKSELYYLYYMMETNDDQEFSEIPQEELEKWDKEFGFSYKGLYKDDLLMTGRRESFNEGFMQKFFGTKDKDELLQRKFEFVSKYMGIIKANRARNVGNIEALDYYMQTLRYILTDRELLGRIRKCEGFIEKDGRKELKSIVSINNCSQNKYYLYNADKKTFDPISEKDLGESEIRYYNAKTHQYEPIKTYLVLDPYGLTNEREM